MIYRTWYYSSKGYWKHFQDQEYLEYAQSSQSILFSNMKVASIIQMVPKNHPFTDCVVDMSVNMYEPESEDDMPSDLKDRIKKYEHVGQVVYDLKAVQSFNPDFTVTTSKSRI